MCIQGRKNREVRGVSFFCQWKGTNILSEKLKVWNSFNNHLIFREGVFLSSYLSHTSRKLEISSVFLFETLSTFLKKFQQCNMNCCKEIASKGLGWGHSVFYDLKWWMQYESSKRLTWIGQTLEWDALWKVNIQSQATVGFECVPLNPG